MDGIKNLLPTASVFFTRPLLPVSHARCKSAKTLHILSRTPLLSEDKYAILPAKHIFPLFLAVWLSGLSIFVEQVRKYAALLELNEAVDRVVNECIRDGILSDFLSKHKAEVIAVSIFEYDEEREIRLIRQDEFRQGQQNILRDLVHKKLQKGKSPAVIADELELEPEVVETLIQELQKELSGSVL